MGNFQVGVWWQEMKDVARVAERLWSKTVVTPSGCFEWTGFKVRKGYGTIKIAGKPRRVHRVAWEIENGLIPADLFVCHKCDNPSCVNVQHLWLGTAADNAADMVNKGRHYCQKKTHCAKGHIYNETNTYITPGGSRQCLPCKRVRDNDYAKSTREAKREYSRLYYSANREAINKQRRAIAKAAREKLHIA